MSTTTFPDPLAPMPAVEAVWRDNRELVDRFKLEPYPGGAFERSWFVMVRCGLPNPDAYELVETLRTLERLVEARSGLDVTLMLSNEPATRNGTHT